MARGRETNYIRLSGRETGPLFEQGMEEPMKSIEVKAFDSADEVRTFDKGKLELVDVNGRMV